MNSNKLTRGATASFVFNLDTMTSTFDDMDIWLVQCGEIIKKWTLSDCEKSGENRLIAALEPSESIRLKTSEKAQIQLRGKTTAGDVAISRVYDVVILPYIGEEQPL